MSTSYYHLVAFVERLELEEMTTSDHLDVWFLGDHGARTIQRIMVPVGIGRRLAYQLAETDADDATCPMRTLWGGKERGVVVRENQRNLDPDATLVSDAGQVLTVREIRAKAGHPGVDEETS